MRFHNNSSDRPRRVTIDTCIHVRTNSVSAIAISDAFFFCDEPFLAVISLFVYIYITKSNEKRKKKRIQSIESNPEKKTSPSYTSSAIGYHQKYGTSQKKKIPHKENTPDGRKSERIIVQLIGTKNKSRKEKNRNSTPNVSQKEKKKIGT